jgi:hypothetical protein
LARFFLCLSILVGNLFDRVRTFDRNQEFVNQFSMAYTYAQVYFGFGKFQTKVGIHAGDIVDIMYIDEQTIFKIMR